MVIQGEVNVILAIFLKGILVFSCSKMTREVFFDGRGILTIVSKVREVTIIFRTKGTVSVLVRNLMRT